MLCKYYEMKIFHFDIVERYFGLLTMGLLAKLSAIKKIQALCVTICLGFAFPAVYATGIYKWVDSQGNVHYGQDPQGDSSQQMKLKIPKTTSSSEDSSDQTADTNEDDSQGDNAKKSAEKQAAAQDREKEARHKNCQIAKKRLAAISAGGRLYEVDEKGEKHYWRGPVVQPGINKPAAPIFF
jgi:hypothetical protein